ncbi:hypothetical protein [Hyphomicrobium sp.]|uniref:hypothetical protein n=1 Tax=Hyphomicrobium sp. TaxID=82 RepID=UPI002D769277|nr:hypothetical protein [Hyphomicrobium sp.]HET6390782.1 hypothetical protein [Hyphomicrobium sp.]
MNELTELASRILAQLEEAHAEEITSTINTVTPMSGAAEEVTQAQSALIELINFEYVRIARDNESGRLVPLSKDQSILAVGTIVHRLHFSPSEDAWEWNRNFPMMEILATSAGLAKARELLNERGYEWWWRQN